MIECVLKEGMIIMDAKSNNLIQSLGLAYKNQAIKQNLELKELIGDCARSLMGNNDDKVYFEVVAKLSHGLVKCYQTQHQKVPQEIEAIYQQIKKDVPLKSVEGKRLQRQFIADHLSAIL